MDQWESFLPFLLPRYISEGKNELVIAIGCTGGRHRSVTMANALFDRLKKEPVSGVVVSLSHRECDR